MRSHEDTIEENACQVWGLKKEKGRQVQNTLSGHNFGP